MTPRVLKEPLLQFLLVGVALFGANAWVTRGTPGDGGSRQVRISEGDVQWLKETWARQWQRDPGPDELRGLVTEFLREELLSREAREMGLDQNDTYVRRRLAQKMQFIVQDASRLAEPTEDDLQTFYAAHPEQFRGEPRVSFTQVYFSREHRAGALGALANLQANADPTQVGERLLVDAELRDATPPAVTAQFGADFSRAVFALAPGAWHGPIESGYGLHLVRVSETTAAAPRQFADVRTEVAEHWRDQRRREDDERYFAGLLQKYQVVADENVKPLVGTLGAKDVAR